MGVWRRLYAPPWTWASDAKGSDAAGVIGGREEAPLLVVGLPVLGVYGAATWLFARGPASGGQDASDRSAKALRATQAAAALHLGYLIGLATLGEIASYAASWSAVAFGVAVAALALSRGRLASLARWLVPTAAVLHGIGMVLPASRVLALDELGGSLWLPVHLALVWAALSGFVAEFCVTVVEQIVRRRLKAKKLAGLGAFPALDALARVRVQALGFGVVTLALGVAAGGMWASDSLPHGAWLADPKVGFTLAVWAWYATAFFAHRRHDGNAPRPLVWSGVGFAALLFLFVGLDFVVSGFHAYGG